MEKHTSVDQLNLAQAHITSLSIQQNNKKSQPKFPPNFPQFRSFPQTSHIPLVNTTPGVLGKPQTPPWWPSKTPNQKVQCQICNKLGHSALMCYQLAKNLKMRHLFTLFWDCFTRYARVYSLMSEDETLSGFHHFKNLVETQFNKKIKSLQTDWVVNLEA